MLACYCLQGKQPGGLPLTVTKFGRCTSGHGEVLGEGLQRRRGLSVSPCLRKRTTINWPLVCSSLGSLHYLVKDFLLLTHTSKDSWLMCLLAGTHQVLTWPLCEDTHTHRHTHTQIHTHKHTHPSRHTLTHICMREHAHTDAQRLTHTHTHTHTYKHTHTCRIYTKATAVTNQSMYYQLSENNHTSVIWAWPQVCFCFLVI